MYTLAQLAPVAWLLFSSRLALADSSMASSAVATSASVTLSGASSQVVTSSGTTSASSGSVTSSAAAAATSHSVFGSSAAGSVSGSATASGSASAASASASGPLPSAKAAFVWGQSSCNDISASSDTTWAWQATALCAWLHACPDCLYAQLAVNSEDLASDLVVQIFDTNNNDAWTYKWIKYLDAQQGGLTGDANGFDWWPAAVRAAVAQVGFKGQQSSGSMVGGNGATGLEVLTGLPAVNTTVDGAGMALADLKTTLASSAFSPMTILTTPSAATLKQSTYFSVLNYTSSTDQVFLDGLDGVWQYYTLGNVFGDIQSVAYLEELPSFAYASHTVSHSFSQPSATAR